MRKAHRFGTFQPYGIGYIKDDPATASFPPFTDAELNNLDSTDLGKILVDSAGRMYMKVRYVHTAAGAIGRLVSFAPPFNNITSGSEPTVSSYANGVLTFADSTTSYTANQLKNAEAMIVGSNANPYGLIREIYSNSATASNSVGTTISEQLTTIKGYDRPYDGNALISSAGSKNSVPTTGTKAVFMPSQFDVVLANSGTASIKSPIGVLLGSVTAKSGNTVYCTWIQIYGSGLVYFTYDGANPRVLYGALISSSTAGLATYTPANITHSTISQIIGYSLLAGSDNNVIIPAFICPTIRPF